MPPLEKPTLRSKCSSPHDHKTGRCHAVFGTWAEANWGLRQMHLNSWLNSIHLPSFTKGFG
jgi:hypothetical protein